MVKKLILCCAITLNAWATGDGLTPTLHALTLPEITHLLITQDSVQVAANEENCKDFKLSEQNIRRYFELAEEIDHHDFTEVVEWSACQATGLVSFSDGSEGNWRLQRYRAGQLTYSDGSKLYLYCKVCELPFQ